MRPWMHLPFLVENTSLPQVRAGETAHCPTGELIFENGEGAKEILIVSFSEGHLI